MDFLESAGQRLIVKEKEEVLHIVTHVKITLVIRCTNPLMWGSWTYCPGTKLLCWVYKQAWCHEAACWKLGKSSSSRQHPANHRLNVERDLKCPLCVVTQVLLVQYELLFPELTISFIVGMMRSKSSCTLTWRCVYYFVIYTFPERSN